jgi:hypothetical protein
MGLPKEGPTTHTYRSPQDILKLGVSQMRHLLEDLILLF